MKPWKKFSQRTAVLPCKGKNTLKKVSFLLLRFLWTSKENEESPNINLPPKLRDRYPHLIIPKPNNHCVLKNGILSSFTQFSCSFCISTPTP
ncbi:MAG: hypothetical protein H6554_07220 [Chitinophagales bacterium]|nr:hypothetical protein [Chitinophagales bacterium]